MHKMAWDKAVVAVGHHRENDIYSETTLAPEEQKRLEDLSPRKKSEWLASRELLFQIAELKARAQCLYDDFGKPYLKDSSVQISVSHSDRWCAAMVCDRSCGVDIQVYSDTVRRIADRFLTPEDLEAVRRSNDPLRYLHLLWGAKECLYKAYGKRKLGFREHIFIQALHPAGHHALGEIRYEGLHLSYDIYFRLLPEVAWVWCVEHPVNYIVAGRKL